MKSFNFPHMLFPKSSDILTDYHECTKQNLINLLRSEKGELLGDPYYGIRLKRYLYDQNTPTLEGEIIDEIYTQIAVFMPQLRLERKNIKLSRDRGKLIAHINAVNQLDYVVDGYDIVLFQEDNKE